VDEEQDLFSPFHALMTHAVDIIGESFLSKSNTLSKNNDALMRWLMCTLNGTETFKEVCELMVPKLTSLQDYMVRLLRIPSMKSFIKVVQKSGTNKYLISFVMSLDCFLTYHKSSFCYVDHELSLCNFTLQSIMSGCERCRINALKEASVIDHSKNCSYIASFFSPVDCPITDNNEVTTGIDDTSIESRIEVFDYADNNSRDSRMDGTLMNSASHVSDSTYISHASSNKIDSKALKHLVRLMYASALEESESGAQGKLLPPPNTKPIKQNSETSTYMLCEFTSCLDDSLFKLWLNREDAIKVSNSCFSHEYTTFGSV